MAKAIDIGHLRSWIGRQDRVSDTLTPELVTRFEATLCGYTEPGAAPNSTPPLGIHWCLALPALADNALGIDGHPAKGGFLPPVPLPRRMWAASRIQFHHPPDIGSRIEKTSTISDVVLKESATSGPLVFVHIAHQYAQDKELLIQETQTIVYRQSSSVATTESRGPTLPHHNTPSSLSLTPNSTLLFRYSALTFNGHRIHYDHNYATREEGYPALVVHGPLMATLLMHLAQASEPQKTLREFAFRGVAPAFVDQALQLSIDSGETDGAATENGIHLEARNHRGGLIMTASAEFGEG